MFPAVKNTKIIILSASGLGGKIHRGVEITFLHQNRKNHRKNYSTKPKGMLTGLIRKSMEFAQRYPGYKPSNPSINTAIEPGIRPLCDALNSRPGVYTIWSCEGHPSIGSVPYVIFVSDQESAFEVDFLISANPEHLGLHFVWRTTANFRDDGSLQYTIQPHDCRVLDGAWWRFWPLPRWNQQLMAKDLARLAELITQITHPTEGNYGTG